MTGLFLLEFWDALGIILKSCGAPDERGRLDGASFQRAHRDLAYLFRNQAADVIWAR